MNSSRPSGALGFGLALVLGGLPACGGGGGSGRRVAASSRQANPQVEPAATVALASSVRAQQIEPGEEPQLSLGLAVVPAAGIPFVLTTHSSWSVRAGAQDVPVPPSPPLRARGTASVAPLSEGEGAPSGAKLRLHVETIEVPDDPTLPASAAGLVRTLRARASSLPQFDAHFEFDAHGRATAATLDFGPTPPGQLERDALAAMVALVGFETVVRPAEPVGVGGAWRWVTRRSDSGVAFDDVRTVRVLEQRGTTTRVALELDQEERDLEFVPPWAPNTTIRVRRLTRKGRGAALLDTGSPLPLEQSAEVDLDLALDLDAQGQKQRMDLRLGLRFELRSGAAASGPPIAPGGPESAQNGHSAAAADPAAQADPAPPGAAADGGL